MRRRIRRVLIGSATLVLTVTLAASGLFVAWLAGVNIPLASGRTYLTVEKLDKADNAGQTSDAFFMLLVGSDDRPGLAGARGDAIHVVGVNPKQKAGTIIDIPRDTCWNGGKINRAHSQDGPRGQANAAAEVLGVNISYVVSVNFEGFVNLVNGAGGVTVDIPTEMSDYYSGANFQPGPAHLDGGQALAFSRDRHDFARGDITRSENQGLLIWSALKGLQKSAKGPAGEFNLLANLGRHAQVDGIGLSDLYKLGRIAFSVKPADVRNVVLPVGGGGCLPLAGDAPGLLADFRDDGVLQSH